MSEIDREKQRSGAKMIEEGLQMMRDADPNVSPGVVVGWALAFGTVVMEEGEDYSGVQVMVPVEGVSWPMLIGIIRGASIKVERNWLKSMESEDG